MRPATITTGLGHGMRLGDIVTMNGKPWRVTRTSYLSFDVMPIGWFRRLIWQFRSVLVLRGFWSRVWDR